MTPAQIMKVASLECDNSTCLYKVGCVAAKNGEIFLQAFNETLTGEKFCQNGKCSRKESNLSGGKSPEIVCAIHAEASLVAQAARKGIVLEGAEIFVTTFPCIICARLLCKIKIGKLFYMSDYTDSNNSKSFFDANNIPIQQISGREVWGDLWKE